MCEIEKCEPPPEWRDRDGWHWVVQAPGADPYVAWWDADGNEWDNELIRDTPNWGWRYLAPVTPPATVAALVEALEKIADHPESGTVLTDYDDTGKQRVWPTVEELARAALAAYREAGR